MLMFPQTRLLFQPPPMLMLSMLPALPMVTALPPPTLYSTSSPMTLPEELAFIPVGAASVLLTIRKLITKKGSTVPRRIIEVLLIIIESPYFQEKFVLPVCSRNRVAIAPRRTHRLWPACVFVNLETPRNSG
ncbi:hypothetical protein ALQ00_200023 [Pseudomonas syringae pv. tomato]|nr:hypothetical protein PSTA9_03323 [Pseudomonas syringae pv. tomato]RMQ63313.1 hypothetical protein ALQ00_200023 [Pseudomonas syringae pv. tomato]